MMLLLLQKLQERMLLPAQWTTRKISTHKKPQSGENPGLEDHISTSYVEEERIFKEIIKPKERILNLKGCFWHRLAHPLFRLTLFFKAYPKYYNVQNSKMET